MAFQSAVDCVEVVIRGQIDGQNCFNTFFGHKAGGYVQADLDALAAAVDAWVTSDWLPLQSQHYTYLSTVVRGLTSAIDLLAENNTGNAPGGLTGDVLPNNSTLSVKRRSAFTGRGARGRIFLPPLDTSQLSDQNTASTPFITAIEAALNGLQTVFDSVSFVEVILHRVAAGVPLPTATIFTLIEYAVVDATLDSMRRRLPKRGT